jgi:selenocysteine lyase/cysteine desulfurase
VESLRLLAMWRDQGLFEIVRGMARRLASELGQPWHGSSLVSPPIADAEAVGAALREAGIKASVRGTAVRLSPHVYTTDADVDRAVATLAPFVTHSESAAA